jgi:hypothetical protein
MQLDPTRETPRVKEDQDKLLNGFGRFDKILSAVSSFWEGRELSEYLNSNNTLESGFSTSVDQFDSPRDGGVWYFDGKLCVEHPAEKRVEYFPPVSSSSTPSVNTLSRQEMTSTHSNNKLPSDLRMIMYSDEIPKPDLPPPPGPLLPDITGDSPLTLLAASSGDALEHLDNSVLENLVPRDPTTGRPLTLGSLQHDEGTCRPCIFFLRAKCFKGLRCTFCHFNHTALRKQVVIIPPIVECSHDSGHCSSEMGGSSKPAPTTKTKRLRPSKRTRELIKQINAQSATAITDPTDLNIPPLSIQETTPGGLPNIQVISRHSQ